MTTRVTNLMYIDLGIQNNRGTKMAHALKDELRKYDHHVIAADQKNKLLEELKAVQSRLSLEHSMWRPCKIELKGANGNNLWLYLDDDCVATIVKVRGELVD
ncbi:MAG: hypothetical protein K6E73_10590 [Bacteroidales bacterium]|nr:hypothetical protein [Bacteroidales bacterium]